MKIVTVTANPCIDMTMFVEGFARGGINRAAGTRRDAAGKGINVSAALINLGCSSLCAGINYEGNREIIESRLSELGIPFDFVYAKGEVRTNVKIIEQNTGVMTEVNMRGGYVEPQTADGLIKKLSGLAARNEIDLLILSGSLPQGVDSSIYKTILEKTRVPAILDAEGACFLAGLGSAHKPLMVKPNLYELETAFDVSLPTKKDAADFCRKKLISELGVKIACVSMGGDGALLVTENGAHFTEGLPLAVRGAQGAGDSMVAGMALAYLNNLGGAEMLRYAAAAASASVIRDGTLMCTREGFDEMYKKIKIY
ncbi:MAG: 1-phosphofructokinase family hexose kinase [Defluviitaleaceae bacterium]|nr:1-phosphofructokinase family hexose kinase [Defluviitaleaceae bacterium]